MGNEDQLGPRRHKRGSPAASFVLGGLFFGAAYAWPYFVGGPLDAADQLYLGFFKFAGTMAMLRGTVAIYNAFQMREKRKAAEVPSDTFGTASFATLGECAAAGMLDPDGIYLGMLDGQPIFFKGKGHGLAEAPARQGKTSSQVIPIAIHFQGSLVVTDPKGEVAASTLTHRRDRLGQRVIVFNPWKLHGLPYDRINPLQFVIIVASSPFLRRGLADEIKSLVLQLIPELDDQKNRFFREGSRRILRAVLFYLALEKPERCTLPEMWRIVANTRRIKRCLDAMRRSDALGGLLADLADDLAQQLEDAPEQFADFRAGAIQALDIFEPGGYLGEAVSGSEIDLSDLANGNITIFLVIPQEYVASHGAVLGLNINQCIKAVSRGGRRGEVLFLLDEFANLGKLSGLAESLTALPGLGVRVWMIVQEFAELVRIYGPHTAQTILSQAEVKQFFAVSNHERAQTLSRALGQKTVKTRNYSLGRFEDEEIGESLSESGQPLMRPDEIMLMPRDRQLLFVNGMKPILAQRIPFWFVEPWAEWAAPNPVEGAHPRVPPLLRLEYRRRD